MSDAEKKADELLPDPIQEESSVDDIALSLADALNDHAYDTMKAWGYVDHPQYDEIVKKAYALLGG